jgi:hypothetical protein
MPKSAALTEGPIGRQLLLFALPILAGNIAQSLNGSVNAIWVGRYLGEAALTAAANANSIMFFLIGSVFGIGMAATILIGQAMGRGDVPQARRVMGRARRLSRGRLACRRAWAGRCRYRRRPAARAAQARIAGQNRPPAPIIRSAAPASRPRPCGELSWRELPFSSRLPA